ncbi:Metal-dependent hydrolase, endonuclease/exonuclease/phosphatase family [Klenkia marina]|uniref:Metal-dependent hydrolase, endonuclease/exonuclease/phosphatase family n=1 Tax=Klenkia marina TaxID=1960309 RepID=A0A1G4YHU4_9ACTN|nr:endonuclease/exonuclease/phosphatase family protein [Klenkia marina]SCX53070.1 Metal-dependent hydrolase, endonuclease/exonuclease/phosphatase family [Klenkia marina]
MPSVRLVTFNIHHGVGDDRRHDLERIAAVLAAADPDVVCLQEVDRTFGPRSQGVDQADLLARALGRELVWASAIEKQRAEGPAKRYGNALLTRLPVADDAAHRLPGEGEPRAALRADLVVAGGALTVVATHLSSDSARSRAAQAQALVDLLPAPGRAAVVAGDLNCGAAAAELTPLRSRLADAWSRAGRRHDQAPGWQLWKRDLGLTHPARRPRLRIDQVWVSPEVRVTGAAVLDGSRCSDHHPLQVDLELG